MRDFDLILPCAATFLNLTMITSTAPDHQNKVLQSTSNFRGMQILCLRVCYHAHMSTLPIQRSQNCEQAKMCCYSDSQNRLFSYFAFFGIGCNTNQPYMGMYAFFGFLATRPCCWIACTESCITKKNAVEVIMVRIKKVAADGNNRSKFHIYVISTST